MLNSNVYFDSDILSIQAVRCRPSSACKGPEEATDGHRVVLPMRGVFFRHTRGRKILADVNQALFFNRGVPYSVSHPLPGGDDCTSIGISDDLVGELLAPIDPAVVDRLDRPFQVSHGPVTSALFAEHLCLHHQVQTRNYDHLEVEERTLALIQKIFSTSLQGRRTPTRISSATAKRHDELVEAVKLVLSRNLGRKLSLGEIARMVHSSPWHLCRVFHARVGVTLHQYRLRLRLNQAADLLMAGEHDLSRLAIRLGFSSHSHFSTSFKGAFGIPPSRLRSGVFELMSTR